MTEHKVHMPSQSAPLHNTQNYLDECSARTTNFGWVSNKDQALAHFSDHFTPTFTCN